MYKGQVRFYYYEVAIIRYRKQPREDLNERLSNTFRTFFLFYNKKCLNFFREIVRKEGIAALYKGLVPNVIGVAPSK